MTPGRGCASTRPGTTSSAAGRSCCRSTPRCSSGSPTAPEDALTDAELTELHDGNAFVRDRAYVFFDWGDACVSHPFHTLVVTLRALAYRLGLEPGSPSLLRLRDAYLEPWSAHGSGVELVETADLARRTGTLQGALAWYATVQAMPEERRHEEHDSVPHGIRLFLRDADLGAWSV